jgi:uncharacterized protein YndB with AHSA1/START domain
MAQGNASTTERTDREVVTRRVFGAPRELVWQAWTTPENLGRWFGPFGFSITTASMEFKPGGLWLFTMHGPDGTDYPNHMLYREIEPPSRLTYEQGAGNLDEPWFEGEVTFEEVDGGTLLTLRSVFPTKEARDFVVEKYGAIEGARQTLERLGAYLAEPQA